MSAEYVVERLRLETFPPAVLALAVGAIPQAAQVQPERTGTLHGPGPGPLRPEAIGTYMVLIGDVEEHHRRPAGGDGHVLRISKRPEQAHRGDAHGCFDDAAPGAVPAHPPRARRPGGAGGNGPGSGAFPQPLDDRAYGSIRQHLVRRVLVHELGLPGRLLVRELLARQRRVEERTVRRPVGPGEDEHPTSKW